MARGETLSSPCSCRHLNRLPVQAWLWHDDVKHVGQPVGTLIEVVVELCRVEFGGAAHPLADQIPRLWMDASHAQELLAHQVVGLLVGVFHPLPSQKIREGFYEARPI